MSFDVFISYSNKDAVAAKAACAALEAAKIRCWMAPRDIVAGARWGASIVRAIDECRVMVLIFSANANASMQIRREVDQAFSRGKAVLPLRIEDVRPADELAYYLDTVHWLDALTPPLERNLEKLVAAVQALLPVTEQAPPSSEPVVGDVDAAKAQNEAHAQDERRLKDAETARAAEEAARREKEAAEAQRRKDEARAQDEQRLKEAKAAEAAEEAARREKQAAEAQRRKDEAEAQRLADERQKKAQAQQRPSEPRRAASSRRVVLIGGVAAAAVALVVTAVVIEGQEPAKPTTPATTAPTTTKPSLPVLDMAQCSDSLCGTSWVMNSGAFVYNVSFLQNGLVHMTDKGSKMPDNETNYWYYTISGTALNFADRFRLIEYDGTVNGRRMTGTAHYNNNNGTPSSSPWKWSAEKQ